MMEILPTNRATMATGVLLLALIVIGAGLWFAKAALDTQWLTVEAQNADIDLLRKRLKVAAQPKAAAVSSEAVFLEGANYALAANALQQRVVGLIETAGGKLLTVGVDQPNASAAAADRRVVVQTVSELDNDGLQNLMYHLEAEQPLVMIDTLTVRRAAARAENEDDAHTTPRLAVDLRVVGYYRKATK